jgi:hypothetical protein
VVSAKQTVQQRPAEVGGFASGLAVLICYIAGVDDPAVLAALAVVVGGLPAVITWIVVTVKGDVSAEDSQSAEGTGPPPLAHEAPAEGEGQGVGE